MNREKALIKAKCNAIAAKIKANFVLKNEDSRFAYLPENQMCQRVKGNLNVHKLPCFKLANAKNYTYIPFKYSFNFLYRIKYQDSLLRNKEVTRGLYERVCRINNVWKRYASFKLYKLWRNAVFKWMRRENTPLLCLWDRRLIKKNDYKIVQQNDKFLMAWEKAFVKQNTYKVFIAYRKLLPNNLEFNVEEYKNFLRTLIGRWRHATYKPGSRVANALATKYASGFAQS